MSEENENKELKILTQEKVDEIIKNHLLYLRWESEEYKADFSNCDLSQWIYGDWETWKWFIKINSVNLEWVNFINTDLRYIEFTNSKIKKADFSLANLKWINFNWSNLEWAIFMWADLTNAELTNSILNESNFSWADLLKANFDWSNLEWAVFIWAGYSVWQLSKKQQEQAILIKDDLKNYKLTKTLKEQRNAISQLNKELKETSDEKTEDFKEWFEKIVEDYSLDERRWLWVIIILFIDIIWIALIPALEHFNIWWKNVLMSLLFFTIFFFMLFLFIIWNWNNKIEVKKEFPWWKKWFLYWKITFNFICEWIYVAFIWIIILWVTLLPFLTWIENFINSLKNNSTQKLLTNWNSIDIWNYLCFLTIEIALIAFLYFAVSQFSKAKKIRIENENKVALVDFFQALRANNNPEEMKYFLPNFANILVSKASTDKKDKELPIDEVVKLASTIAKNIK